MQLEQRRQELEGRRGACHLEAGPLCWLPFAFVHTGTHVSQVAVLIHTLPRNTSGLSLVTSLLPHMTLSCVGVLILPFSGRVVVP